MSEDRSSKGHAFDPHGDVMYRFCPVCGYPLHAKVVKYSEPARLVCAGCEYVLYLDPKVAVGTLGTLAGRIVLLRRGIEPAYGKWVFPGGYVDRGESVTDAGIREAKEEVNLDVRIEKLLNVYSYPGRPVVLIVYVVTTVGGELCAGDEAIDVGTFSPEEIPWEDLAFLSTRDALKEYVERCYEPAPGG